MGSVLAGKECAHHGTRNSIKRSTPMMPIIRLGQSHARWPTQRARCHHTPMQALTICWYCYHAELNAGMDWWETWGLGRWRAVEQNARPPRAPKSSNPDRFGSACQAMRSCPGSWCRTLTGRVVQDGELRAASPAMPVSRPPQAQRVADLAAFGAGGIKHPLIFIS